MRSLRRLGGWLRYDVAALRAGPTQELCRQICAADDRRIVAPVGEPGYALPDLTDGVIVRRRFGRTARWCDTNWLVTAQGYRTRTLASRIRVDSGRTGNIVLAARGACLPRSIHFQGNDGIVILGANCPWFADLTIRLSSDRELLFWGAGATSNGSTIVISGDEMSVVVGEDCMFAVDTVVHTSDLHAVLDRATGEWLNPPRAIVLEPHVWVGQAAMILKGARIGAGSVIGAKSLVGREIPRGVIAAGVPARIVREGVAWDRASVPTTDAQAAAGQVFAGTMPQPAEI